MGRFHVGPTEEAMALRAAYESNPDIFVPPASITPPSPSIEIKTEIIEVIKEVKVPEYITVIKEVRVEVPVMTEVERIVEKIVEIPRIQVIEKPVYITKEIYDVNAVLLEKKAHGKTKRTMKAYAIATAVLLVINILMVVI